MPVAGKMINLRAAGKRLAVESNTDTTLKAYLDEIAPLRRRLTAAQERKIAATIRAGILARQAMIQGNLLLVANVAAVYSGMGVPIKEIISFGNEGLVKAVDAFDPSKGRFSTFATWYIRAACTRGIANTGKLIRLPHNMQSARQKIATLDSLALSASGVGVTDNDAAEALGMSLKAIKRIRAMQDSAATLDRQDNRTASDGPAESRLSDKISDGRGSAEDQALAMMDSGEVAQALTKAMAALDDRERVILVRRYRGGKREAVPYEQLGRELGISHTRVGQIEKAALAKLRTVLEAELGSGASEAVSGFLFRSA